jgi:AraC family transcriptional regulator, activator of mtrCDE
MYDEAEIFRELAPLLRVRPEIKDICRFGAQWASQHDAQARGWAAFHIVTRGGCLLDAADQVGIPLKAGDAAILPHGGPHTVRARPMVPGPATLIRIERRLHDEILVKTNVDGEPDTKIICGRLFFEHAHGNIVLAAPPSVVVLAADRGREAARLRAIIETIQAELEEDRLGASVVAASLASSLMAFVLRAHFEDAHGSKGILALLARPQTVKALAAMLADLARDWTLDELAKQAHASRATLVRLFQAAVSMAPLAFLAELRFTVARHRILASDSPLNLIAAEVGYQSEAAFSRAYHRRFGSAPGAERKERANIGGKKSRP